MKLLLQAKRWMKALKLNNIAVDFVFHSQFYGYFGLDRSLCIIVQNQVSTQIIVAKKKYLCQLNEPNIEPNHNHHLDTHVFDTAIINNCLDTIFGELLWFKYLSFTLHPINIFD